MDAEQFEALTPEEQAKIFHHSTFKERAELIRRSHDPRALTRALSHEELYLLTREMDIEERGEVIKYATLPQLFFISDIDCWKKDRIDGDNFMEWLETLKTADEKVLLQWLLNMDYGTVVTGFQKVIKVLKPEWEYAVDELLGDTPYFTIDQMYYVAVGEENLEIIRRVVEILFENNRGRYTSFMEGIMAEVEDQVEEEAYQSREVRLADRGFPDYETARKIYRPISREEFDATPLKNHELMKEKVHLPNYPVLWSSERLFLDDVLILAGKESEESLENIHEELSWVSNKVLAGQGIDFSSEERVRRGIERARFYVSLGLEDLSGGDLKKAVKILMERWCENIFRWGISLPAALKESLEIILKTYWQGHKIPFFDFLIQPYDKIAQGLMLGVPQYFDFSLKDTADNLRDFKTVADIERIKKSVLQIEKIHGALAASSPKSFSLFKDGLEDSQVSGLTVLGTLFARFCLDKKPSLAPLSPEKIKVFAENVFEMHGSRPQIKMDLRAGFLTAFHGEKDAPLMSVFWSFVFQEIEDELALLDFEKPFDERFVKCLLIKPTSKPKKAGGEKT